MEFVVGVFIDGDDAVEGCFVEVEVWFAVGLEGFESGVWDEVCGVVAFFFVDVGEELFFGDFFVGETLAEEFAAFSDGGVKESAV